MESSKDTSSVAEQLVDRLRGMRPKSMFDVENPPFLGGGNVILMEFSMI